MMAAPASAAAVRTRVDIVKVSGLIDPLNADLVARSIRTAAVAAGPGPGDPAQLDRRDDLGVDAATR